MDQNAILLPLEITEFLKRISIHKEANFKISNEEKGPCEPGLKFICLPLVSAFSGSFPPAQPYSTHSFGQAILGEVKTI